MTTHYDINWLTEQFESGDTLKYIFFWGYTNKNNEEVGKFCFSQWFESPFTVDNITYMTAEHWMMAQKALVFNDKNIFEKIIRSNNPAEAKELGRQVKGYNDQTWNEMKFEIVRLGNIHKFNQHPKFADYLLKTENRILVEASPIDTIWGIGLSQESKDIEYIYAWRGQNLFGFALMETRDFLKAFGHFKALQYSIQPPWTKFPNIDSNDMFWRMGKGENYLFEFSKFYHSLTDREKTIYKLSNPQPYEWTGFYD
ncbi:DUF1768 domain-containing protein [Runella rosea]|uniref:DUF1768 domain-containing protein n=1 Tax=Runella rosea TaxID=2259595 RepID=A0A344TDR9_9BACT|nr:NADAR family protein [Runella rosea]AXE16790.1 DUF1768 domain-containing protein [Runella rosea]